MMAALNGHTDALRILLENSDIDINAEDGDGKYSLYI